MKQKYNELPMFPVRTFQFKCTEELLEDTYNKVKTLGYRTYNEDGGVGTSSEIQMNPDFEDLHDWFQECIDTLHAYEAWHCDRLVVNKSWVNRSDKETGHRHQPHRHPMSSLSGIFYITDTPEAPTVFLDPIDKREWSAFHLDGGPAVDNKAFYHGGAGGLIVFPSWLVHATVENYSKVDRYSIAFNTFPQGNVNKGGWDETMANVTVNNCKKLGPLKLSDYR